MKTLNTEASRKVRSTVKQETVLPVVTPAQILANLVKVHAQVVEFTRQEEALSAQLFDLMKSSGKKAVAVEEAIAAIEASMGKASNVIDVKKYKALVSEEDFFKTVKVGIGEAKKILTELELKPITTHTPAQKGEDKLTVKYLSEDK